MYIIVVLLELEDGLQNEVYKIIYRVEILGF